mmetsp:Transcript_12801/g.38602  ORF Transcript_12801/g.38602 Transcript_12801/m.38602 type:complete len:247 (+) Transcript_12801:485-1225(+)
MDLRMMCLKRLTDQRHDHRRHHFHGGSGPAGQALSNLPTLTMATTATGTWTRRRTRVGQGVGCGPLHVWMQKQRRHCRQRSMPRADGPCRGPLQATSAGSPRRRLQRPKRLPLPRSPRVLHLTRSSSSSSCRSKSRKSSMRKSRGSNRKQRCRSGAIRSTSGASRISSSRTNGHSKGMSGASRSTRSNHLQSQGTLPRLQQQAIGASQGTKRNTWHLPQQQQATGASKDMRTSSLWMSQQPAASSH